MKSKTLKSILLFATFSLTVANADESPLYQQLSAETQTVTALPLKLTEINRFKQTAEGSASVMAATATTVVMASQYSIVLFERVDETLVKKGEYYLKDLFGEESAPQKLELSDDGKTIVYLSQGGTARLKVLTIAADYNISVKQSFAVDYQGQFVFSEQPGKFLQISTSTGLISQYQWNAEQRELLVDQISYPAFGNYSNYYNNFLFDATNNILVKVQKDYNEPKVTLYKFEGQTLKETDSLQLTDNNYNYIDRTYFDVDTGSVYLEGYNKVHVVQLDKNNGKILSTTATNSYELYGRSISSSNVSTLSYKGDYLVRSDYNATYVYKRSGKKFAVVAYRPEQATNFLLNLGNKQAELFTVNERGLYIDAVNETSMKLKYSRLSHQRENNWLTNSSSLVSLGKNSLFGSLHNWFIHYEITESGKFVTKDTFAATAIGLTGQDSWQVVSVSNTEFLLLQSNKAVVLTLDPATGKLTAGPVQNLTIGNGSIYLYNQTPVLLHNNVLYVSLYNYLHAFQYDNKRLQYLDTAAESVGGFSGISNISKLVQMNQKVFAFNTSNKIASIIDIVDKRLVQKSKQNIPALDSYNITFGLNKVFVFDSQKVTTLLVGDDDKIQLGSISHLNYYIQQLIHKRFSLTTAGSTGYLYTIDQETGIWSEIDSFTQGCCQVSAQQIGNRYISVTGNFPYDIIISKIDSAPYLTQKVPELSFNQGVSSSVQISGYFKDDEDHAIQYSGLDQAGFSLTDSGKLEFNGNLNKSGVVQFDVIDSTGMVTSAKVAFKINLAPFAKTALPQFTVNQGAAVTLDLNDYIEDPEGAAIQYQVAAVNGLTVSKSGFVTGVISTVADTSIPLVVTDKSGATFKTTLLIKVNAAPVITGNLPAGKVGTSYSQDLLSLVNDPEKQSVILTVSGYPAGLSLNGTTLAGQPTQAGSFQLQIVAVDTAGARASQNVTLSIAEADKKGGSLNWFSGLGLLLLWAGRRQWRQLKA